MYIIIHMKLTKINLSIVYEFSCRSVIVHYYDLNFDVNDK